MIDQASQQLIQSLNPLKSIVITLVHVRNRPGMWFQFIVPIQSLVVVKSVICS